MIIATQISNWAPRFNYFRHIPNDRLEATLQVPSLPPSLRTTRHLQHPTHQGDVAEMPYTRFLEEISSI
jgi:hypothetical protein